MLINDPANLTLEFLDSLSPRYVFFLHWSWATPSAICQKYECVGFHMTDLPYGRGGTPLQNLILAGHERTKLTAFRLTDVLDGGPVYAKRDLSLDGTAAEIYARASRLALAMIQSLIATPTEPVPQIGDVVTFRRRTPEESRLPEEATIQQTYDFIRMLDADGYPHAFLECGGWRLEFRRASLRGETLVAQVSIRPAETHA